MPSEQGCHDERCATFSSQRVLELQVAGSVYQERGWCPLLAAVRTDEEIFEVRELSTQGTTLQSADVVR